MSFGASLFRLRAMIARPPIMSFDFGPLKIQEGFSTIPFKSIHRDLRTVGARGGILRLPSFYFSESPNVGGGGGGEGLWTRAEFPKP